jgi:hypothetical protein
MNPIGVDSADVVVRPLSGSGIIARSGSLVLVCSDDGHGVDDLLAALSAVAGNGGDGNGLVRRVSALLASDEDGGYPACAVAGPVADGRVAVLVHKAATAEAETESGAVSLTGEDAITSVDRLVPGPVTSLRLYLPDVGATDPRLRLDEGVVLGGGVVVEVASALIFQPDAGSRPAAARPAPRQPAKPAPVSAPDPDPEPVEAVEVVEAVVEPAAPEPLVPSYEPAVPAYTPPVPAYTPPAPEPIEVVEADVVPPAPAPSLFTPNEAGASDSGQRPSYFREEVPPPPAPLFSESGPNGAGATEPVVSAPPASNGIGALTLDDGTTFTLDTDYLVGRDPRQDPEVIAGVVKALRVADPDGVISRRHARITVVAGQVRVFDLGSANGTFMELPGDPQRHRLTAGEPTVLTAGARVIMGRRWLRYDP